MSHASPPHGLTGVPIPTLVGLATLVASQLWLAPEARADVVMSPPARCPPGAIGDTGHMGAYCAPTSCDEVADCDAHRVGAFDARDMTPRSFECRAAGLCMRRQSAHFGRGRRGEIDVVLRACARDEDCADGVECEHANRCVEVGAEAVDVVPDRFVPSPFTLGGARSSCGAAAGASALVLILMGAALAGFGLRRARTAQVRAERIRAVLASGDAVSHRELLTIARSEAALGRALAPVAARLRVEAGEDGELEYVLQGSLRAAGRAVTASDR